MTGSRSSRVARRRLSVAQNAATTTASHTAAETTSIDQKSRFDDAVRRASGIENVLRAVTRGGEYHDHADPDR